MSRKTARALLLLIVAVLYVGILWIEPAMLRIRPYLIYVLIAHLIAGSVTAFIIGIKYLIRRAV